MNILIVYDSFFGNTQQIAQAMGKALDATESVEILRVNEVEPEKIQGLDFLIVGSPTRGFRPTEAISKFLKTFSNNALEGINVAAFDTRFSLSDVESSVVRFIVKTGGYAAKSIANELTKKGGNLLVPPEGFLVVGEEGPLKEGELERSADWAAQIIAAQ